MLKNVSSSSFFLFFIFLFFLSSIQKRTSPIKFAHLAEKTEKGSISNLSTKIATVGANVGSMISVKIAAKQQHDGIA